MEYTRNVNNSLNSANFLPVSAFSAYSILRNCSYMLNNNNNEYNPMVQNEPNFQNKIPFLPPQIRTSPGIPQILPQNSERLFPNNNNNHAISRINCENIISNSCPNSPLIDNAPAISKTRGIFSPAALLNLRHSVDSMLENSSPNTRTPPLLLSPSFCGSQFRKHRSEKKPIPDEQKDDKYFERRRRNNQAAKKSRDARKMREDQIALKATILEHENAILRAQILTLREESSALRQMLLNQRKNFDLRNGAGEQPPICLPS